MNINGTAVVGYGFDQNNTTPTASTNAVDIQTFKILYFDGGNVYVFSKFDSYYPI